MMFPVCIAHPSTSLRAGYVAARHWWGPRHYRFDSAREIREYFIPDFSDWEDHDSYQKAFQRLVGDLKADASE